MRLSLSNVLLERKGPPFYRLLINRFDLQEGEVVAITGPSGSGKSTVLDIIGMVLQPNSIESYLLNPKSATNQSVDIAKLWQSGQFDSMSNLRRHHIAYVLQTSELLPYLNVEENILLPLRIAKEKHAYADDLQELLECLDLTKQRKLLPAQLSIGQRQRAAILRAVITRPDLLLADEPMAALDPKLSESVLELFEFIARKYSTTVVIVTHDVTLIDDLKIENAEISMTQGTDSVISAQLSRTIPSADISEAKEAL